MQPINRIVRAWNRARADLHHGRQQLRLAAKFAAGRLSAEDAARIRWQCEDVEGCYPLEFLDAAATAEAFADIYGDHPALPELAREAVARVASRWDSDGHLVSAAQDWAFNLMRDYAVRDGIALPHDEQEEVA